MFRFSPCMLFALAVEKYKQMQTIIQEKSPKIGLFSKKNTTKIQANTTKIQVI